MAALQAADEDEAVLAFDCAGEQLYAVMSRPPAGATAGRVGVVIVVGGPQYRAGSHRQFVLWARAFARAGFPALRFDVRGMGDSAGAMRPFTALSPDIGAAIDALRAAAPAVERVVLCGLCDGAAAALLYLDETADPRVAGLVLLNPWVRSEQTLARTYVKHYYLQRLRSRSFWAKLLSGRVALGALRELGRHLRASRGGGGAPAAADRPYTEKMADALLAFSGPVLLGLSGKDYTAKEFIDHGAGDAKWSRALGRSQLQRLALPNADHTVSDSADRLLLEQTSAAWMLQLDANAAPLRPTGDPA